MSADLAPEDVGIRVVIVDDHELVRHGLRSVLEEHGIEVVAEAANGHEAIETVLETQPDVLLLDLRMPKMDGIEVCRTVTEQFPDTRVLVLTSYDGDFEIFGAMEAGASGYVMKDVTPEKLVRTVRGVAEDQMVLDLDIAARFVSGRSGRVSNRAHEPLSEREGEVLGLIARGLNNKHIAQELWISEATVKTHVSAVLKKLKKSDRTQAVLEALRLGIVSLPEEEI